LKEKEDNMIPAGIDKICFYTPRYYLPLEQLAVARGVDPAKYFDGIGQVEMAVTPPCEDIITLGASAASSLLQNEDLSNIELFLFATETSVDQSKSAGTWVHHLLNLPKHCRLLELKQACYAATGAIQLAFSFLQQHPQKKVLVIASDIARYGFNTPGEPTQGACACAILLSTFPRILTIEPEYGLYCNHVMDFWRPNYMQEGLVDGKYSIKVYLNALDEAWKHYKQNSGRSIQDHTKFAYHLPFTKMAIKAHQRLRSINGCENSGTEDALTESLIYGKRIGNSYTASLFVAITSLLENCTEDLAKKRIGLFSYGSGCMAEYFSAIVQPNYQNYLMTDFHRNLLNQRQAVTVSQYEQFYGSVLPQDGTPYTMPIHDNGQFRFTGLDEHKRLYSNTL